MQDLLSHAPHVQHATTRLQEVKPEQTGTCMTIQESVLSPIVCRAMVAWTYMKMILLRWHRTGIENTQTVCAVQCANDRD